MGATEESQYNGTQTASSLHGRSMFENLPKRYGAPFVPKLVPSVVFKKKPVYNKYRWTYNKYRWRYIIPAGVSALSRARVYES